MANLECADTRPSRIRYIGVGIPSHDSSGRIEKRKLILEIDRNIRTRHCYRRFARMRVTNKKKRTVLLMMKSYNFTVLRPPWRHFARGHQKILCKQTLTSKCAVSKAKSNPAVELY